jgi:hypothetical protein
MYYRQDPRMNGIGFFGRRKVVPKALVGVTMIVLSIFGLSTEAFAAQPRGGPYAPENYSTFVKGWVDMDANCPGIACHTYMKVERSSYRGWQFVAGGWISGRWGWSSMTGTKLSGCYDYRTVVEVYTDVAGGYGSGINVGPVGYTSSGTKIYRFKNSYFSSSTRACM